MSLNKSVYADGNYKIEYTDTANKVEELSNSISNVLPESAAEVTKFSMGISDELGNQKLNLFYNGYGFFIIINKKFLVSKGDIATYETSGAEHSNILTDTSKAHYTANPPTLIPFRHLYEDLLDSSKGFIVANEVTSSFNQRASNIRHIIFPRGESIYSLKINLNLNHYNESGVVIIDCDSDDNILGNIERHTELINSGDLKNATNTTFAPSQLTNGVVNGIYAASPWYNSYIKDNSPDADRPKFKYIVVPIKQFDLPENSDPVCLGLIVFDKHLDAFQFRFINDLPEDEGTVYGLHHNGYGEEVYSNIKAYHHMDAASSSNEIYICTFSGFSFSDGTFEGLRKAACKQWGTDSKLFSIAGDYNYDSAIFQNIYEQLPVAFGNRLLYFTDPHILNNIYSEGFQQSPNYWSQNSNSDHVQNVGFFNIAYATLHGFILMRLHSYAPIILSPSNPDGIELHIPGGKWNYQAEDGSYPFQEAGGFTPISMEFSPDNNFLYAIVAKPTDRTVRYLCVYNLTNLDTNAINDSVQVYKDFEDASLKNVRIVDNNKIIVSSDSNVYRQTSINSDIYAGVLNLESTHTVDYNFNVAHGSELFSTATSDNTWRGTDVPIVDPGVGDFISTASLDSLVLTPKGYLDISNPENGLIENSFFNKDNTENWINSITITDSSNVILCAARLERVEDITSLVIFNPDTAEIYESYNLQDQFIHPGFYENPNSLSYARLRYPINSFAIIINYSNANPTPQLFAEFFDAQYNTNDDSSWIGYAYSVAAVVDISQGSITVTSGEDLIKPVGYNENLRFPSALQFRGIAQQEVGTNFVTQTYNHTKFISLQGSDTYIVQVVNIDGDFGHDVEPIDDLNNLEFRLLIKNITGVAGTSNDTISIEGDNKFKEANATIGVTDGALGRVALNSTFGSNGVFNAPTHSYTSITHDVSKTMAIFYSTESLELFVIKNNIASDEPTESGMNKFTPTRVICKTSLEASQKILGYLNSDNGYAISGAEFSANKQNIYLLLTKAYGTENLDGGSNFKLVKINTGTSGTSFENNTVFEIPDSFVELVSEYYYNEATASVLSDYSNFPLPSGVDKDTVADTNIQNNTIITGMFKSLNHSIYLISETIGEGIPPTLGKIINADQISGENNYNTKYIKAGILL